MPTSLHPIRPTDHALFASWAIAEQWPGQRKGAILTEAEFPGLLDLPGHYSFCLSEENRPAIGFGQIWINAAGAVNLVRILIAPHLRGQGLGKMLCALLVAEAGRLTGTDTVKLRVRRNNAAAVAVYSHLGFQVLELESNSEVLAMALRLHCPPPDGLPERDPRSH